MSTDNPKAKDELIQYFFEVSLGRYILELQRASETAIDLKGLPFDLLQRFFHSGWKTSEAAPHEDPKAS